MFKLRIPYKIRIIFETGKTLTGWVPYIRSNPRRIKFIPRWIVSFLPGKSAIKDGLPFVTFETIEWLDSFLTKEMNVAEWGTGGSTVFFAKKAKNVVAVEHHPNWYRRISQILKDKNIQNCRYILKEPKAAAGAALASDDPQSFLSSSPRTEGKSFEDYCRAIDDYPDDSFDLISVDGRARPSCIARAISKVRPLGFILLDDSDGQEYARGAALMKDWKRKEFFGPKSYAVDFYHTTIWQKPAL